MSYRTEEEQREYLYEREFKRLLDDNEEDILYLSEEDYNYYHNEAKIYAEMCL